MTAAKPDPEEVAHKREMRDYKAAAGGMLVLAALFGAFYAMTRVGNAEKALHCWDVKEVAGKVYKVNRCDGRLELVEPEPKK